MSHPGEIPPSFVAAIMAGRETKPDGTRRVVRFAYGKDRFAAESRRGRVGLPRLSVTLSRHQSNASRRRRVSPNAARRVGDQRRSRKLSMNAAASDFSRSES